MKIGAGQRIALYFRWIDGLSELRFTGISIGPLFIGVAYNMQQSPDDAA